MKRVDVMYGLVVKCCLIVGLWFCLPVDAVTYHEVDWQGYYWTKDGRRVYDGQALREKRRQYGIMKRAERRNRWLMGVGGAVCLGAGFWYSRRWWLDRQRGSVRSVEDSPADAEPSFKGSRQEADLSPTWAPADMGMLFERYVGKCYEENGFDVEYRGFVCKSEGKSDDGIDLVIRKNGRIHYAVQCKCNGRNSAYPVNVPMIVDFAYGVQDLASLMGYPVLGILACTNSIPSLAFDKARERKIALYRVDSDAFGLWMDKDGKRERKEIRDFFGI